MTYITLLRVYPQLIEQVSIVDSLTVEQIYQFVLQQADGSTVTYHTRCPYSSIDIAQIVESAATHRLTVIHKRNDNRYVMELYVQQGFGVRV